MRYWSSLILIMGFFSGAAWASPDTFTYQGRIVRDNGTALEYNDVAFAFTITNEAGNCVLYREVKSHVNMQGSKGIFDVPIGSGVRQFPTDPSANIRNVFVNSVQLDCEGGTHYTAAENEGRILIVQFHDGVGWESITPSSKIRSVPFSTFSYSAGRLGNKLPGEYVLKSDVATCSTGQYLTFNGTTFTCQADSGGSGTISDINVSSPLTKGGTATLPTIGISVGTAAGTVAAGNDTRFGNALKIQGVDVNATAPTSGQVLRYDGTSSWVPATLGITDISGLSTQLSNKINATMFPTSCTAGQSLVFVTPANKFDCYDISISSSQISGTIPFSKISSLPTTLAGYGITDGLTGTGTAGYIPYYSGASTLASSAIYQSSGKVGIMTNSPRVGFENNGTFYTHVNYSGTMPTFNSTIGSDGGLIIGWNGDPGSPGRSNFINFPGVGAGGFSFHLANSSGAVTNTPMVINEVGHVGIGTTSPATQLEVIDTTGAVSRGITSTTYATNPGGLIQLRGARGTPASPAPLNSIDSFGWIAFSGYDGTNFSSQDFPTGINAASTQAWSSTGHGSELRFYTTPNNAVEGEQRLTIANDGKVGIGTATPAYALDVSGVARATQLCIGTDCRSAWPAGGSGSSGTVTSITTGTGLTGGTITTSGIIAADVGTTANKIVQLDSSARLPAVDGSSLTNVNATKIQGTNVAITSLTSGNFLKYNGTNWVNSNISSSNLSDASDLLKVSNMPANCSAGQTLTFSSPSGTWTCSNIVLPAGTLSGSGTAGYIPYYSAATTLANSAIYQASGKVGIGTTAPATDLEVSGSDDSVSINVINRNSTGTRYPGLTAVNYLGSTTGGSPAINFANFRGTPGAITQLQANDNIGIISAQAASNTTGTNVNSAQIVFSASAAHTTTSTSSAINFKTTPQGSTNMVNRMTIADNGFVGIGTSNPMSALQVITPGQAVARIEGFNSTYVLYMGADANLPWIGSSTNHDFRLVTNATEKMRVTATGNVGIGDQNPYGKLQVTGGNAGTFVNVVLDTASVGNHNFLYFRQGGANIGSISSASGTNISYNTTSDIRLKDGFAPVNSALDKINSIEVKNYYYKADPSHRMDGFIAQQLYPIAPYAVTKPENDINEDGTIAPWLVDYSKMIPLVTASVQELSKKVEAQNREIASLKEQNLKLQNEQAEIKKWICSKDPKSTLCH